MKLGSENGCSEFGCIITNTWEEEQRKTEILRVAKMERMTQNRAHNLTSPLINP